MRAIQTFLILLHTWLNRLAGTADKPVNIPHGGYLLATAGIILHVWTLNREVYAMGVKTLNRISSLLQVTHGERIWLKVNENIQMAMLHERWGVRHI